MAQIVFKLTDNKFDEFISRPLCAGDTNAYKIELSTNIDLTDCTIRIQAVRKDNVAINGLGYIVDGKATYTLPQNMYSVAGELEVRILILDAAGDTLTQKRVFFDCLDKLSDGEFYAGVDEDKTVAAQVLAHINNKSNPHDVTYNQVKDWDSIIHLGTLTGEFKVGSNGEGDYVAYEYNAGENILKFGRDTIVSFAPDEATYNNDHIMLYIYGYAYGINDPNPQYRFKNIDGTDAVELGVKTYLLLLTEDIDGNNIAQIIGDDTTNNISDTNAASLVGGSDTDLHYHSADRNRANHTGTQTASTILDFAAAVGALVTDKLTFHIVAELPDLESPLLKTDEIYFVWTQDEDYDSVDNPAYNYDMYICTPSYSTGAQPLTWTKLSGGTESSAGVLGTTLTGLSTSTSAGVYPTDTILSAIGKLQGQINGINLSGTGNAIVISATEPTGSSIWFETLD